MEILIDKVFMIKLTLILILLTFSIIQIMYIHKKYAIHQMYKMHKELRGTNYDR